MPGANVGDATMPPTYQALCERLFWPRPIHDDVDYRNATDVVDRLALMADRNADQEDYLEAISTFVEKYDRDLLDDGPEPSGGQTLRYLMEGRDMTAADLGRVLSDPALGTAVLEGSRPITPADAARLGDHFKVSPSLFLRP